MLGSYFSVWNLQSTCIILWVCNIVHTASKLCARTYQKVVINIILGQCQCYISNHAPECIRWVWCSSIHRNRLINPQRMREGYSAHLVCVCYQASCYIIYMLKVWYHLTFCADLNVCWSPLPYSLPVKLSMDKRDSDGFFLRRLACRTNDWSYNSSDSSLITVDYRQSFLACFLNSKTADQVHA